ncbi:MAG TPA: PaaI family thioesterase [Candidatus Pseudomonas excrementavium]|uniref:PaaI family thioesterase n=1 Tax=Halopseudomonas bauzanensis TaxID=653930 RepID=UPI001C3B9853|nr:PaaI family thioesterase [Halopseudomonas bauzanensis]HIZ51275.1 PaaI family thioesterase [Candidatus Pseudomonas excrementavium]HJE29950.1 PaaI family thioesterase [Stutzerimonas nitrititolerans]
MSQHPKLSDIQDNRMSPFTETLGLELVSLDQDGCTMRLEISPQHFNTTARVHGGVIFSLLDSAMGAAVYARLDAHEATATIECKINYTRAVTGGVLECRAKVMHAGTRTMVVDGEVWQDGALAAKCLGTFARI